MTKLRRLRGALVKATVCVAFAGVFAFSALALAIEGLTTYLQSRLGPKLYDEVAGAIQPPYTLRVVTREGYPLGSFGQDESMREPIDEVPQVFRDLLVAFEDTRFDQHNGVDRVRMLGAFLQTIRGQLEGGSTVTMQLAKMLKGDRARTLRRKLDDMALALELEKRHGKDEIMRLYADHAYFGHNVHGLKNACLYYFNRPACTGLRLEEAAYLVGLVKAPSKYARNPVMGITRRDTVLMVALGPDPDSGRLKDWIDLELFGKGWVADRYGRDAIAAALSRPLEFKRAREQPASPYLRDVATRLVTDRLGPEQSSRGARVTLTIGAKAQAIAEMALEEALASSTVTLEGSRTKIDTEKLDGGVIVLDARNGDVMALVGGRDYGVTQVPFALSPIQVGSALKPLVYALGFDRGVLAPHKTVVDGPICIGTWCPKNYGGKYYGALQVEDALARSLNSVAVRTARDLGVADLYLTLRELGFESALEQNLTLALGASEVTMLELAQAYTALLDGAMKRARLVIRADRRHGERLFEDPPSSSFDVFDRAAVASVREGMMRALRPGGTAVRLGADLQQHFTSRGIAAPPEIACKTGTTNNSMRVGMACLVSDSDLDRPLIVTVYLGHHVPQSLGELATGGRLAGPAMFRILSSLLAEKARYASFGDAAPSGRTCSEAEAPLAAAEVAEEAPQAAAASETIEVTGPYWLSTLRDIGVSEGELLALQPLLDTRLETKESFHESLRDEAWGEQKGIARALSLVSKLARFVSIRGLDARSGLPMELRRAPEGFTIVEEQPDRTVTRTLYGRTDIASLRAYRNGGEILAVDVTESGGGGQTWLRQGRKWRQARAVSVLVNRGAFAAAWLGSGLDGRQYLELRQLASGAEIDFDHIRQGFEVQLLLSNRRIIAARVLVPDKDGHKQPFTFARSEAGVFDGAGLRSGGAMFPVDARDIETFKAGLHDSRVIAALLHADAGAPVWAPTRARVLATDAEAHSMELQAFSGSRFSLRGIVPHVVPGDVVSGGTLLGRVDPRESLYLRVNGGLQEIVTYERKSRDRSMKRFVADRMRQLDAALAANAHNVIAAR